ncbi:MAG: 30S ribosomal protein S6 [Dethiobacteria bacterium]
MGYYEIMLIIRPDVEADGHQEVLEDLKAAITKEGGDVSTILDWRKRRLAYEINKHKEGHYYLVYFSGQGTIIPEIEHYFRVTDAVIRYMVVSVEEKDFNAAAEKAAEAASAAEAQAEKQEEAAAEETAAVEEPEVEIVPEVDEEPEAEGQTEVTEVAEKVEGQAEVEAADEVQTDSKVDE